MKKLIQLFFLFVILIESSSLGAEPTYVPTFECVGIYWNPAGGSATDTCNVQYRRQGDVTWKQGFPLVFFNRADGGASYIGGKYRGSIVNLTSNTAYEIFLKLKSNSDSATFTAKTWSEIFPVAQTIELPVISSSTLNITTSGSPTAYILYAPQSGSTATIDVSGNSAQCINVSGSYIILRGLTLKNGADFGILLNSVHDIVIENCDISGWGKIDSDGFGKDYEGAIYSRATSLTRVIIQRTKMHHPRSNSNNWQQPVAGTHPGGPQCVTFFDSDGNFVFRYNEVYSDENHRYNDCFGAGTNGSFKGFPNRDSDVYGNYLSCNWDDAIEMEGANRNVRVWGNFMENGASAVTAAATSIGPYYIWRNVVGKMQWGPDWTLNVGGYMEGGPGSFFKGGSASDQSYMGGQIFIFHNTLLQPLLAGKPIGCGHGIENSPVRNVYSRNNILQMRSSSESSIADGDGTCDYQYDLFNGTITGPSRSEMNGGKKGVPVYSVCVFDSTLKQGSFQLASASLGFDQGYILPNFNDNYAGTKPDIGAQEAGTSPIEFGVNAYITGQPEINKPENPQLTNSVQKNNSLISDIIVELKNITFFIALKNSGDISLDVYNIIGKKIWKYKNKLTAGVYSVTYENTNLPQGQYFVKLRQDNRQAISRFVVIK